MLPNKRAPGKAAASVAFCFIRGVPQVLEFLLSRLADGAFHSGEVLAKDLGVTRAAINKRIQEIEQLGLPVHRVRGRGYRLAGEFDLLSAEAIAACLDPQSVARFGVPSVHLKVDSTNSLAMEYVGEPGPFCCVAESQEAGRGRLGRRWESPFGANIYLSMLYRQNNGAHGFEGLSLVVGLSCAEMLREQCCPEIGLKWPNDLLLDGCKVGGILLEIGGDLSGCATAVIGVGINVHMDDQSGLDISQPWTSLDRSSGMRWKRNILVGALMNRLAQRLEDFERGGFQALKEAWEALDVCAHGSVVELVSGSHRLQGRYAGINDAGGVRLETETGLRDFFGGEISLRGVGA